MVKINKKDHEIEVLKLYNDELQKTNDNLNKEIVDLNNKISILENKLDFEDVLSKNNYKTINNLKNEIEILHKVIINIFKNK
jgi:predicted RNase H-like nuclease (RuvC/YqgF family)